MLNRGAGPALDNRWSFLLIDSFQHEKRQRHSRNDVIYRVVATLAALILFRLALSLPLPGLSLEHVSPADASTLGRFSIATIAITAWLSVVAIAELLVLLLPKTWTRLIALDGHADPFAKPLIVLAILLAAVQGYGLAMAMQAVPGLVVEPGSFFVLSTCVSVAGGTAIAVVVAAFIQTAGVGRGFWVLLAATHGLSAIVAAGRDIASSMGGGAVFPVMSLIVVLVFCVVVASVVALVLARRRMGHAAVEPVIWPLVLYGIIIPWIAVLLAQLVGAQDPRIYAVVLPNRPLGLFLLGAILAGICWRYASMERSGPFLWPTVGFLFVACVAAYAARDVNLVSVSPGLVVLFATIATVIVDDLRGRLRVGARKAAQP